MDAKLYASLRGQILQRHAHAIKEADDEREADLAALDRVARIAGYEPPPHPSPPTLFRRPRRIDAHYVPDSDAEMMEESLGLTKLVEAIVTTKLSDRSEFTLHDIQELISETAPAIAPVPSNAITQVLRRLAERSVIQTIEIGQGRRPTTYIAAKARK